MHKGEKMNITAILNCNIRLMSTTLVCLNVCMNNETLCHLYLKKMFPFSSQTAIVDSSKTINKYRV